MTPTKQCANCKKLMKLAIREEYRPESKINESIFPPQVDWNIRELWVCDCGHQEEELIKETHSGPSII